MKKTKIVRVKKELTPEQRAKVAQVRKVEMEHKEEYVAEARQVFAARDRAEQMLRDAFARVRQERQSRGLTFAAFAELAGMSRGALSNLEQGTRGNPTLATLLRCAEALGLEVSLAVTPRRETADAGKK